MSWLKAITGGVIGAEALNLVKAYVEQQGGLEGVVKKIETTGFGREVKSWISTDPNKPLSEIEIGQALGMDRIKAAGAPRRISPGRHRQGDPGGQAAGSREGHEEVLIGLTVSRLMSRRRTTSAAFS